jgi:hypothetical protein
LTAGSSWSVGHGTTNDTSSVFVYRVGTPVAKGLKKGWTNSPASVTLTCESYRNGVAEDP